MFFSINKKVTVDEVVELFFDNCATHKRFLYDIVSDYSYMIWFSILNYILAIHDAKNVNDTYNNHNLASISRCKNKKE